MRSREPPGFRPHASFTQLAPMSRGQHDQQTQPATADSPLQCVLPTIAYKWPPPTGERVRIVGARWNPQEAAKKRRHATVKSRAAVRLQVSILEVSVDQREPIVTSCPRPRPPSHPWGD